MDEREFEQRVEVALAELDEALGAAADQYGFEPDFRAGAMTVEFDDPPAKFVVSPNSPVRQIWVSALTKSFKLHWDEAREAFVLKETGQTLRELMADVIGRHLGEAVRL
jgi:CyaY protein